MRTIIALTTIVVMAPVIWLLFSVIDYRRGKTNRVNWKGPMALYLVLAGLVLIHAVYLNFKYEIPIFINTRSMVYGLIAVFSVGIIFSIGNIVTTALVGKTEQHDPKMIWKFIGGMVFV